MREAGQWLAIVAGFATLILLLAFGAAWAGRNTDRGEDE